MFNSKVLFWGFLCCFAALPSNTFADTPVDAIIDCGAWIGIGGSDLARETPHPQLAAWLEDADNDCIGNKRFSDTYPAKNQKPILKFSDICPVVEADPVDSITIVLLITPPVYISTGSCDVEGAE